MYQIKDVKIDWMVGYGNSPMINILFDDISESPETWEHVAIPYAGGQSQCYMADKYGLVHVLYSTPNHEGFGGRIFSLTMKDGSVHKLHGPWHGGAPNHLRDSTAPCIEIHYTGEIDTKWLGWWTPSLRAYPKTWGLMTYFGLYAEINALNLYLALQNKPWRIEFREEGDQGARYSRWCVKHQIYGFKPEDYMGSSDARAHAEKWRKLISEDPIERENSHGI